MARIFGHYGGWLRSIQPQGDRAVLATMIRRILLQVGVNLALVIAIFLAGGYFTDTLSVWMSQWIAYDGLHKALIWGGVLLVLLVFLIAVYRKLKAPSTLLVELRVKPEKAGRHTTRVRRVISEVTPLLPLAGMVVLLAVLSSSIPPPGKLLVVVVLVAGLVITALWRWLIRVHSRMQITLMETLDQEKGSH